MFTFGRLAICRADQSPLQGAHRRGSPLPFEHDELGHHEQEFFASRTESPGSPVITVVGEIDVSSTAAARNRFHGVIAKP